MQVNRQKSKLIQVVKQESEELCMTNAKSNVNNKYINKSNTKDKDLSN